LPNVVHSAIAEVLFSNKRLSEPDPQYFIRWTKRRRDYCSFILHLAQPRSNPWHEFNLSS